MTEMDVFNQNEELKEQNKKLKEELQEANETIRKALLELNHCGFFHGANTKDRACNVLKAYWKKKRFKASDILLNKPEDKKEESQPQEV